MNPYSNAARVLPRDERILRQQRALELGASDPQHLRLVANDIDEEGIVELPGVDADRLRLLAAQLEADGDEITALREHADNLHRALCEAIGDLEQTQGEDPIIFVFAKPASVFETLGVLTPEQFSDLAMYLLDEIE